MLNVLGDVVGVLLWLLLAAALLTTLAYGVRFHRFSRRIDRGNPAEEDAIRRARAQLHPTPGDH